MTDVHRPLIVFDRRWRRADEAGRPSGIDGIRPRHQLYELRNVGVGRRSSLRIAENHAVEDHFLRLAKAFVRGEEERLARDDGPTGAGAELIALEGRRLA